MDGTFSHTFDSTDTRTQLIDSIGGRDDWVYEAGLRCDFILKLMGFIATIYITATTYYYYIYYYYMYYYYYNDRSSI